MTTSIDSYSREETVNDILLRLAMKSLLLFKCVSKSWHDLIKSSSFIKKHFNSESNRARLWFCKFGVDYRPQPPLRAINFFLLPEKLIASVVPARQRIYRCEGVSDFRGIYGPVDGLFLLEKGIFYLMFGLDSVNQDYKVLSLRIYTNEEKNEVYPKVFAAIYSSNNDSWKYLDPNFPYDSNLCESLDSTHLNGVYCWLCLDKDNVYCITTFDFVTELFGEMEGPPISGEHWGALMLRGGSLAAMSCDEMAQPQTSCYDIWARIGENNWIKVYTVNPPITWHWPLGIWEYDKFIYEMTQTYIVYYNHTAKEVTDFGFNFTDIGSGSIWPITYKESLVPINRENPTEQDNVEYFFTKF
ncbi:probable F-box protein At1g14315 [Nicotiana sylvestris]|uniref:probable F-box protein At1g14315 n=1 Tax=Nicotiana sylvestris TaxID=4096 RepID=UPI00388CB7A7